MNLPKGLGILNDDSEDLGSLTTFIMLLLQRHKDVIFCVPLFLTVFHTNALLFHIGFARIKTVTNKKLVLWKEAAFNTSHAFYILYERSREETSAS